MSDFFTRLVDRAAARGAKLEPRTPARFESAGPEASSFELAAIPELPGSDGEPSVIRYPPPVPTVELRPLARSGIEPRAPLREESAGVSPPAERRVEARPSAAVSGMPRPFSAEVPPPPDRQSGTAPLPQIDSETPAQASVTIRSIEETRGRRPVRESTLDETLVGRPHSGRSQPEVESPAPRSGLRPALPPRSDPARPLESPRRFPAPHPPAPHRESPPRREHDAPSAPDASPTPAAPSETVVKVTIGRVDVRAVNPRGAPQRTAPKPAPAAVSRASLEDFLRRRQERSR